MLIPRKYKIFIIGLGQIGGSLGHDLTALDMVDEVIGYDKVTSVGNIARKKNIVNRIVRSVQKGISQADIIILATPIRIIIKLLPDICKIADKDKIIIDVAGTKKEIFNKLKRLNCSADYFSCHPIAGAEKEGITGAQKGLFKNAGFIVVPVNKDNRRSLEVVCELIRRIKAKPLIMSQDEHDRLIALTSNLPYTLAVALSSLVSDTQTMNPLVLNFIGGSYKSATRVAMSSPELTLDMLMTNGKNISKSIDSLVAELNSLQKLIIKKDQKKLRQIIQKAKNFSDKIHNG